jgi:monovalent cation:H+ antiporter-2, CPA2 family
MAIETGLLTLGIMLLFAIIGAIISFKTKQPLVVALLLVGAIIGPNSLNLIKDFDLINSIIEIGAIILLFVVGLEFDLTKLAKLGTKAILVTSLKVGITLFLAFLVLIFFVPAKVAVILAITISFSSTVVIVKVLEQKKLLEKKEVPLLIGMLIVEDIFAVGMLTFFSAVSTTGGNILDSLGKLFFSIVILIIVYVITWLLLGPVMSWIKKNTTEDMILLTIGIVLCIIFSYVSYLLKLSPSFGAFLAGSLIASLPEARSFERKMDSFTVAISALFFISMGTMVNFKTFDNYILIIVVLIVTVVISRLISVGLVTYLFANFNGDQVMFSTFAMFSVGEFSLLLAQEGMKFNLGVDIVTIIASTIFITALLMSLTLSYSAKMYKPIDENTPKDWKRKVHKLSHFVRSIFEEVDLENKYSTKLKDEVFKIIFCFVGVILVGITGRSIFKFMFVRNVSAVFIYLVISLFAIGAIYLLIEAFKRIKDIFGTITMIFSNRYFMNLKKSRLVLKHLIVSFVFLLMALFSPLLYLIIEVPKGYSIMIPIVLIVISAIPFARCMSEIDSHSGCSYCSSKKEEHNFFRPVHNLVPNNNATNNGKKDIF